MQSPNTHSECNDASAPNDFPTKTAGERVMELSDKRRDIILWALNQMETEDANLPIGSIERLARFAEWTNTTPPEKILEDHGDGPTLSNEILTFALENGLSLDWFLLGDEQGLVLGAHNAAKEARS
ncbi:hypothetical protein [Celeribacter halophilus]|uniref:hypothetical protein n=1 Tax=Celeribacter halophilus TaxID=576117 RepID=UPI003A943E7A